MGQAPNPDEAAAIAAAIQRFRAETAAPAAPEPALSPWQRAALLEGVGRRVMVGDAKGEGGTGWLS